MIRAEITSGFVHYRALGEAKAMTDSDSRGSSGESTTPSAFQSALDNYLRDKGKGSAGESGQYRRNAERVLQEFLAWCRHRDFRTFDDLDSDVLREYVSTELLDPDLSPRTIDKYYDYLSAWVGWCQREGLVPEHYGVQERTREPLPDKEARRKEERQQTWLPESAEQYCRSSTTGRMMLSTRRVRQRLVQSATEQSSIYFRTRACAAPSSSPQTMTTVGTALPGATGATATPR
jgi:hypothetical protein